MNLALLGLAFIVLLFLGYRLYGGWVARQFVLDDGRITPANKVNDGVDYVPAKPTYLFAQHFSAIAAAGPIAGPILACQAWGWVPCLLWISLGVVFIGAVHDFSSLVTSVRHGGCTIAEITRKHMGGRAGVAVMLFIWLALIYVIVAFTDLTASTFVGTTEELAALDGAEFNQGGAVAASAIMYLSLAVVMGLVQRFLKPPLWLLTIVFVPAALGVVWLGTQISTWAIFRNDLFLSPVKLWGLLILLYCALASITPVWALLQPRGYLGGFILYIVLGVGLFGVFFGGYEIEHDAFKTWDNTEKATGALFPFLFVTIACGACSGFHGLVCSGTTSKQIDRESHTRPIGYGAMLCEGFVALIALVTIMIVADTGSDKPGVIYGKGIGEFLTLIIGEQNRVFAEVFGTMAFSTFVFDTLDICTRLGRFLIQEICRWPGKFGVFVGTTVTTLVPAYFIWASPEGSYLLFWTLFGASNQLLAALTLLAITVWLYKARRRIAFTLLPMLFVLAITVWSLGSLMITNIQAALEPVEEATESTGMIEIVNALVAFTLVALSIYLAIAALVKARGERLASLTPEV